MEDRVITVQDVIDAGACKSGVLKFVAKHGVIAMPASQLANLARTDLSYTPLDGFGDDFGIDKGNGFGNGYGFGTGVGDGDGYGYGYGTGNSNGGGYGTGNGYGTGDFDGLSYGEGYGWADGYGNGYGGMR